MTCSNDCLLKLFNLPEPLLTGQTENLEEMTSVLKIQESETVYDYSWYPLMSSADPATCCFATTSSNTPIHLWDAFTGELRCSYRAFNQVDEVTPAHCVSFSGDGSKLYCGFNKTVRVFNVDRPGRQCEQRLTYMKEGQAGIISCIASSPLDAGLYAAGSYSRSVALYYEPNGEMVCMFQGHQGGVTHIQFTPDGTKLLSGGRKDPEILCWDLRNPGQILFTAPRKVETNQRIYFDVDNSGRYLVSGNHDGTVSVWDMTRAPATLPDSQDPVLEPVLNYKAHNDTVNGASLHPSMPLLVTSSGQRHFSNLLDSDEEDTDPISNKVDNSVRLWYM
ncbi:telomerase Cajal body protein 1-like [Liolophura sinensis]|uniref:telomerase Cajal body protein 1-like n=1 Tax=Liolophura sinensis TaxID=3198878 RepID=UPI0031582DCC